MNWDKYRGAFGRFHDTTAKIVEKGNYNSLWNTYEPVECGSITGDLQDYSGELAQKDYGLSVECQKKFYCSTDDNVRAGRYLIIGEQSYRIEHIADGKLGLALLLKEGDFDGERKRNT